MNNKQITEINLLYWFCIPILSNNNFAYSYLEGLIHIYSIVDISPSSRNANKPIKCYYSNFKNFFSPVIYLHIHQLQPNTMRCHFLTDLMIICLSKCVKCTHSSCKTNTQKFKMNDKCRVYWLSHQREDNACTNSHTHTHTPKRSMTLCMRSHL